MSISKKNAEGYFDPTAYEALNIIIKAERRGAKSDYPRVYICSPFMVDVRRNVVNALKYCRFAVEQGYFPLAPHCYLPLFMNDNIPAERELALSFGLRLLYGCREVWVFGDRISGGMNHEISAARKRNITVKYFTENCREVYSK